jgi:hypothetical protein
VAPSPSRNGRTPPLKEIEELIKTVAVLICAADNPDSTLIWTLLILLSEMQGVNDAASSHIATLSENHLG